MLNVESNDSPQPTSETPLDYDAASGISISQSAEKSTDSAKKVSESARKSSDFEAKLAEYVVKIFKIDAADASDTDNTDIYHNFISRLSKHF